MRVRMTIVAEYNADPEYYSVEPEEFTIEHVKDADGGEAIFEWLSEDEVVNVTFEEIK